MARSGVTYRDVVQAAEAVKQQGQEPTVDRVRGQLGTGSKSTIGPLLKRWRSDLDETANLSGLPSDLVETVKALHERVQQMADQRIEQAREKFDSLNASLRDELVNASQASTELEARQQDLESQIERLSDQNRQLNRSLEEARVNLAKTESVRDEGLARIRELKEMVTELRQENKDVREHFEHYQQRTAEDRQQEREQFRVTNQQMQSQLQELRGHLTQAEGQISELKESSQLQQQRADNLDQLNADLRRELIEKVAAIEKLDMEIEVALFKNREHQEQKDRLSEQLSALEHQKAEANKELALLSQSLETTKTTLNSAQDKIMLLTDENKVILQEKAVIQGQFKQLQASL